MVWRGGDDARRLGRVVRPADDDEQVDRKVDDDVHGGRWTCCRVSGR